MRRLLPAPVPAGLAAFGLAALGLAWGGSAVARAGDLASTAYERTLMREAGSRCKLFEPRLQRALDAGALQARTAALRAGVAREALDAAAARASLRAAAEPCGSAELHIAAQRVRAAFLGWSRQSRLDLPGERGGWRARRWPDRPQPFWALSAASALGGRPLTLGLRKAGRSNGPAVFSAESRWPGAGEAYLARLVLRDPARAPEPYLAPGGAPPPGALTAVAASGKRALDGGAAWRFTFPDSAAEALARLDPREHARLELVFPGERTVSTLVEAGDFAVGRAFLAAGP